MASPVQIPEHVEEIAAAAAEAIKALISTADMLRVERKSQHAVIVAYFVGALVRVDIKPRTEG